MSFTSGLVKQHDELVILLEQIYPCLTPDQLMPNIPQTKNRLNSLSKILNNHLLVEDRGLYPVMLEHSNITSKEIARIYIDELGGLRTDFFEYFFTWDEERIKSNPELFIEKSQQIFTKLTLRIEKENTILYPFFERLIFYPDEIISVSEEELAAKLEINRMTQTKAEKNTSKEIEFLLISAEREVKKQDSRFLFKNYDLALKLYHDAYLLGHSESIEKIKSLSKK